MNRLQRLNWVSTYTHLTVDERLILLQGMYEAFEDVLELVDEVMFDREISDKESLKQIQQFLRNELKEIQA